MSSLPTLSIDLTAQVYPGVVALFGDADGQVVAEQIGAQIFIDGWAMVAPGDPDQAVRFAEAAARVSHDGEAVYGAKMLAAMESMAFVENDIQQLIDIGLTYIPKDSVIARMIADLRAWHEVEKDWRGTRELLAANYGYDKYGGNCHMVPNHGLIIHSLLHGDGDFSKTLKIVNTCGWDTDCNGATVGGLWGLTGSGIPSHWVDSWRRTIQTSVAGFAEVTLEELTKRTLALVA